MSNADYYREQYRRRIAKERRESNDLKEISGYFLGLVIGIVIILVVCILAVPKM